MKKLCTSLNCSAFTVAVLSGIWLYSCGFTGLLGFAGFTGCTSYFACSDKGLLGLKSTIIANLSGIFWAMAAILAGIYFPIGNYSVAIYGGIITFMIVAMGAFKDFRFIPGAFMGCFSTFACGGDWRHIIPSVLIGAVMGFLSDISGQWLYKKINGTKVIKNK